MECESCSLRSSVGYCAECRKLLCEVCGVPCKTCGKIVCREHTKTTSSGKELCADCYAERQERKKRHAKGESSKDTPRPSGRSATPPPHSRTPAPGTGTPPPGPPASTSFDALGGAELVAGTAAVAERETRASASSTSEEDTGPVISDEALGASGYKPAAWWKKSLKASLVSLVALIIIFQLSGYWWAYLPDAGFGAVIVILIPLVPAFYSVLWSVMGLFKEVYIFERGMCLLGLLVDLVSLVLALGIYAQR
jgi:hypothetical protein